MDNSGPFSTQRIHIDLNSFRYPDEDTFQNQVNLLLDQSKCHIGEVWPTSESVTLVALVAWPLRLEWIKLCYDKKL